MSRNYFLAFGVSGIMMCGLTQASAAQDIKYTYLEGAVIYDDFSPENTSTALDRIGNDDNIGFSGRASVALPDFFPFLGFHIVADYAKSNLTLPLNLELATPFADDVNASLQEVRLAAGAHFTVIDRVSLFLEAGYSETLLDIEGLGSVISDNDFGDNGGLDVRLGARIAATDFLEVNGFARINPDGDFVDSLSEAGIRPSSAESFGVGIKLNLIPSLALVSDYEFGDSLSRLRIGARFEF